MATQFASRLALLVFAATAVERMWSPGDLAGSLQVVLGRAAIFYGLGLVCGELARRIVEESAQREFEQWIAAEHVEG